MATESPPSVPPSVSAALTVQTGSNFKSGERHTDLFKEGLVEFICMLMTIPFLSLLISEDSRWPDHLCYHDIMFFFPLSSATPQG